MSGSPYLDRPTRSLAEYRDELVRQMRALPFHDRRRAVFADRIRQLEATIDRVTGEE